MIICLFIIKVSKSNVQPIYGLQVYFVAADRVDNCV